MSSPPLPSTGCYQVAIDWQADGTFAATMDDVTAYVLASPGIRVEYGRDTARAVSPPMIGAADVTLLNEDRSFSPGNPASPRYQYMEPGRPIRIEVTHGQRSAYREHTPYREHDYYRAAGRYSLFLGATSRHNQATEWGNRTAAYASLGTAMQLQRKVISTGFLGGTPGVDLCITMVLDAAGWPLDKRAISLADGLIDGYWVDERPAWDALVELLASEGAGAMLYEDPDGVLHFENRNYRATSQRSLTPQYTFHDGSLGSSGVSYRAISYDPRWEDLVSRVTVTTTQRQLLALAPVWQLSADLYLPSGPQTILARPQDPFLNAVTPVAGTDYTVTDGTVTVTLDWSSGAAARITVTPLSGAPTVHNLQIRANPWSKIGETVVQSAIAPDYARDEKTLSIAAWPQLSTAHAQAIADSYLARYKDPHPIVKLSVGNDTPAHMDAILNARLSDRVRIVNTHLGLDQDYWIESISHAIGAGGRHDAVFSCEPVVAIGTSGARWDAALWNAGLWGI